MSEEGIRISALPQTGIVQNTALIPLVQGGATVATAVPNLPFNRVSAGVTQPTSPKTGDLWFDTSGTDPIPKVWNGVAWVSVADTSGGEGFLLASEKSRVIVGFYAAPNTSPGASIPGYSFVTGDLLFDITNGRWYSFGAGTWTQLIQTTAVDAIANALGATSRPVGYTAIIPSGLGSYPAVNPYPVMVYSVDGKLWRWDQTLGSWTTRAHASDLYGTVDGGTT